MSLLTNTNNQPLVDQYGRLLLNKEFSKEVISEGLIFHGKAENQYLTLVDGLVSEALDVRGNGKKMVQNTVTNRATFTSFNNFGAIKASTVCTNTNPNLAANFSSQARSLFLVAVARDWGEHGFVRYANYSSLCPYRYNVYNPTTQVYSNSTYFKNLSTITSADRTLVGKICILHTITDFNALSDIIGLRTSDYILEWAWYDRVLSLAEAAHNVNALNANYKCF